MEKKSTHIDLLDRFFRGLTSPEEEKVLFDWFKNNLSEEEIYLFYKRKWQEVAGEALPAEVQGRMFYQLKSRMRAAEATEVPTRSLPSAEKRTILRWWSYAAAVVLLIGLGISSYLFITHPEGERQQTYLVSADKGQRASLTLPDGTKVWLNSHSSVAYDSHYGERERTVTLTGEAYFEVAKDAERRFIVQAGDLEVEALGTTFNVKAYEEDEELTATLFEGKVRTAADGKETILAPGQQASFNKTDRQLRKIRPGNSAYARMWRDNELAFERETLGEIAKLLNRMYNVRVEFASERIKHYRFSGVIKNNSLDNVFEIISLTAPILYESRGDTILLREKRLP